MKPRPPGSIPAIGTLNIVFGALFTFCCLSDVFIHATGSFWFFGGLEVHEMLEEFLTQEIPIYLGVKWGTLGLGCLIFVLMLVSGMGLVSQANWGRVMAILIAWILVPFMLLTAIYDLAFYIPALNRFLNLNPILRPAAGMIWTQIALQILVYLLFLIYGVVTLATMMGSRVRAFFHETAFQDQFYGEEDWDDDPYDDRRRRWRDY